MAGVLAAAMLWFGAVKPQVEDVAADAARDAVATSTTVSTDTTDTTVTFAYKLAFQSRAIGDAAALNVLNLVALMIASSIYVVLVNRRGGL